MVYIHNHIVNSLRVDEFHLAASIKNSIIMTNIHSVTGKHFNMVDNQ